MWEEAQLAGKTLGVLYRLQKDEIYFVVKPGFYEGKAKSSDQAREVLLLDLGPSRGNQERNPEIHEETSLKYGNGDLRFPWA